MTTQPALVAKQVRLKEWAKQIRDCQNRPKGMDIETWCTQNHLTERIITIVCVVFKKLIWNNY